MTIKGLKVGDIMQFTYDELKAMEDKDLKTVASRLFSASNKRIKRLQQAKGVTSPALIHLTATRGGKVRFSRAGKSKSQLISEIASARDFMERRTASVTGARAYMSETEQRIGGKISNPLMRKKFWKKYREFAEANNNLMKSLRDGSKRVQRLIREEYVEDKERDWGKIFENVEERLDEEYRADQERLDDMLEEDWE